MESGELCSWIAAANGCVARSFFVRDLYSCDAASNIALKLAIEWSVVLLLEAIRVYNWKNCVPPVLDFSRRGDIGVWEFSLSRGTCLTHLHSLTKVVRYGNPDRRSDRRSAH